MKLRVLLLSMLAGASVIGCKGSDGPPGPPGASGTDGTDGTNGSSCTVTDNSDGTHTITCTDGTSVTVSNGADGVDVALTNFHGTDFMQSSGEFATGKFMVNAAITSAAADAAGVLTVNFRVTDLAGKPVTASPSVSANVAKLAPAPAGEASNRWVPYITRTETVSTVGDWPAPVGTTALQGSSESTGTLTNHGDGTYTYRFAANLSTATTGGALVGYERSRLHRVSIMMGGHDGATADANFDFVPDGTTAAESRAIVTTHACKACHGEEFHGHGGNRLSVENCATCHLPGTTDANGGESLDLKVMIHKIHAGGELASLPGNDGIVWNNPDTMADESADNGEYAIWGYRNTKHEWWKAEFPAVIENCQKCHHGTVADVDNWKTKPSRAACGSCHDTVNFATGEHHAGGAYSTDDACAACHGPSSLSPVATAHDWTTKDERNIPEFDIALSVSTPANGTHFVAGEAPVITLALTDKVTGQAIDHTTMVEDLSAEGCTGAPCPPRDGLFANSALFVHGPRARRMPVLTTTARAQLLSAGTGPWDLSASGAALVLKVDAGQDVLRPSSTSELAPGTISVPVPATGAFANKAAATTAEIVAWLNANAAFARRAIAWNENGRVGIRSRNLGTFHSLQLQASAVTTAVFGGNVTAQLPTGGAFIGQYFAANYLAQRRAAGAVDDPKVTRNTANVTYRLDPVDDLPPGTYVALVEIADRGRVSDASYKTPSVAKVAFQVKTATPEKPVASNCDTCHQGPDGRGFILDFGRHYKIFGDDAVDQCGACHDYQNGATAGGGWTGGHPLSKRVHAVHFGSSLFTPLATVAYSNGDPVKGRNWDITFPQDVRNCQVCHPDGDSSGTWASNPARLPCMGCHDGDAAKAHMSAQTFDPTPTEPWSGDEKESCTVCH